jgi:CRISPR-associated endonuclease/helicase Cas3
MESYVSVALETLLAASEAFETDYYPDYSGVVITGTKPEDPVDDSDESSFSRRVTLADHTSHVRTVIGSLTKAVDLLGLAGDLDLAVSYHDLGKSDPRFQALLYGGREREPAEPLLAKSEPRSPGARGRAAALAGWPRRARHEFLSAALLTASRKARRKATDWDLVQHLVGAHHGFGRPFPPLLDDPHPVEIQITFDGELLSSSTDHGIYRLDSGWADRFWQLIERYGYWGMAFLETLVRRADCIASRMEEEGKFDE